MRTPSKLVLLAALAATACVTTPKKPKSNPGALKPRAEAFHRTLRWVGVRDAGSFVAPERKIVFLKAALDARDEETLKITEYEIQDIQFLGARASVLAKVDWYRLPSVTTKSEAMVSEWEETDGLWMVRSIQGGPVPLEPAPEPAAPAAPAPAPPTAPVSK